MLFENIKGLIDVLGRIPWIPVANGGGAEGDVDTSVGHCEV